MYLRSERGKSGVLGGLVLGVGLAAMAAPAAAQPVSGGAWYLEGGVTASLLNDSHGTVENVPAPGNPGATLAVKNEVETGWGGRLALGYSFGRFRAEGEVGYTENNSDRYTVSSPFVASVPQEGRNDILRFMANGYVDLATGSIRPYVGGGMGLARVKVVTVAATIVNPTPMRLVDDSDTVFAYQLMGGAAVALGSNFWLTGQYRWFDAGTIEGKDGRGERFTRGISGHNIEAGVRITF